jgi:hypothetical protein
MRQPYSSKPEIPVPVSVSFEVEGAAGPATGWIARLSVAGVDIETLHVAPIGSKIVFQTALDPASAEVHTFNGLVRWASGSRMGVQFSELGAKETHAIIEAMRGPLGDVPVSSGRRDVPFRAVTQSSLNLVGTAPVEPEIPVTIDEDDE